MATRTIVIWPGLATGRIGVLVAHIRRAFADTFGVDVSRIIRAEDGRLRELL